MCYPEGMKTVSKQAEPNELLAAAPGLGWGLGMLLRAWSERVDTALATCPAGSRGFLILSMVVHHAPPSQAVLAAALSMDRTVLTYLIDDLEQAGLVERQPVPGDRRARMVVATEAGRAELAQMRAQVRTIEDEVLSGLDEGERMHFRMFVMHAANAVQATSPDTDPCVAVETVTSDHA